MECKLCAHRRNMTKLIHKFMSFYLFIANPPLPTIKSLYLKRTTTRAKNMTSDPLRLHQLLSSGRRYTQLSAHPSHFKTSFSPHCHLDCELLPLNAPALMHSSTCCQADLYLSVLLIYGIISLFNVKLITSVSVVFLTLN